MAKRQPLTQKERIIKLLTPTPQNPDAGLTQEEARVKYGIKSLSSRISELRWIDGYPIDSKPFVDKNGKAQVRYVLMT